MAVDHHIRPYDKATQTKDDQIAYIETFHEHLIDAQITERIAKIPEANPDLLAAILNDLLTKERPSPSTQNHSISNSPWQ